MLGWCRPPGYYDAGKGEKQFTVGSFPFEFQRRGRENKQKAVP